MRYVLGEPISWSEEFPTLAFSSASLWAASFCLSLGRPHRFDLVHDAARPGCAGSMAMLAAAIAALVMVLALPAILDFALYMQVLSRRSCASGSTSASASSRCSSPPMRCGPAWEIFLRAPLGPRRMNLPAPSNPRERACPPSS